MADLLNDDNVEKSLKGLDGWNYNDAYKRSLELHSSSQKFIQKEFVFNSFESAATFVQHVASIAGELGHYPEILIHKESSVTVTSSTTDENGVTENDIALAESIEILVTG